MLGQDGHYWLLDFGIARHLDLTSLTPTLASGIGTLGYAPPEQYRNWKSDIDARADLFALGVVAFEAAAGRHPYRDGVRSAAEVIDRIENQPQPALQIQGDTGGRLSGIVSSMMRSRRSQRPNSAADALAWLKTVLAANTGS